MTATRKTTAGPPTCVVWPRHSATGSGGESHLCFPTRERAQHFVTAWKPLGYRYTRCYLMPEMDR